MTLSPSTTLIDFNSHAHVERDLWQIILIVDIQIFQLTRSRGA